MKRKYKLLAYTLLPSALGLSLLGATVASAHGLGGFGMMTPDQIATQQQNKFQEESQILGISVDEVKTAWADGKSLKDIMTEKNISQDQVNQRIKDLHDRQLKTQLQTLVDKGVITQAQADARVKAMQNLGTKMPFGADQGKKMGRGHGGGRGFGF